MLLNCSLVVAGSVVGVDVAVVAVVPATAADEVVVAAPLPEPDQVRLGDLPVERFNQVVTPAGSPTRATTKRVRLHW